MVHWMPPPRPIAFQATNGATSQTEVASVLLVDDDRDFHLLVKEMLGRLGRFEVTSAESVDEALALLSKGHYDVIVADYLMPGATGLDMLRTLRSEGNDTPFVMFTGKGREDVAIDALNSGADFYVQKGGDSGASFANLSKMIVHLVQARCAERRGHESLGKAISKLQELDSIVNQSPVIVATWLVGERWPMGYISSNVSQLGYSAEDFMSGRVSYADIVHPEDLPGLRAEVVRSNESGSHSWGFEYRVLTKAGDVRWINERTLIIQKEGVPIGWQGVLLDITDRKLAERRIHDLAMIVDSSHDAIYGMDLDYTITSWNRAAEELYGYSAAEAIGTKGEFLVPDDIREELASVRARVRNGEKVDNYEAVRLRKDGTRVDVAITFSPVRNDSGKVVGFSLTVRDISERKRADHLLAESELKYRTLFDGANDAIYILDAEGRILDVNKTACEQSGYSRNEIIGGSITEIEAPSEAGGTVPRIDSVKRHGAGFFESMHKAKDGREFPVEVSARLIEYASRPALMEVTRDISERKMAEDALRTVMSSLEDLESIVTSSPAVVFQWTYSGREGRRVQFVSNNVQQFGYAPSELVSKMFDFWELVHPDDRVVVASEISKYHETGAGMYTLEYRIVTKDGGVRWVEDRTSVVMDDAGLPVRHQGIVMDITARKLAEEALKNANEKLNLLGSITRHDVANQLGILVAAMSLLEEESDEASKKARMKMMQEAVSTISQQLEFAGSYQKAGTKQPEWVHVRLDIAVAVSSVGIGGVKVDVRVGNMEVWADPMFERVLFNLFDNAIRHGGEVTAIRIFTERRADAVVLVFEDDGVGVSPEEKEIIFGKGYGVNTGHGLFLCREILGITGLTIMENGVHGEGSRFEIYIPGGKHRGQAR